jgi:hypothetical protein
MLTNEWNQKIAMDAMPIARQESMWKLPAILVILVLFLSVVVVSWPKAAPDESVVGMSKQQIRENYREPDQITFTARSPSVVFDFDEKRRLVDISSKTWMPLLEGEPTTPMDFQAFANASPDEQHRMLMHLVRDADRGRLPAELKSLDDVEARFPNLRFSELWEYWSSMFQTGMNLDFDKAGICTNAREEFF